MASGYALPTASGGSRYEAHSHHAHSHSYSGPSFPPSEPAGTNGLLTPNGPGGVKKAVSSSALYTHTETSRETSPLSSPGVDKQSWHTPYEQDAWAFDHHHGVHGHVRNQPSLTAPAKSGRPRGQSDLGRPAGLQGPTYSSRLDELDSMPRALSSWLSLPEALTAMLIPLPYLLASAAYSSMSGEELGGGTHPLPVHARMQHGAGGQSVMLPKRKFSSDSGLIEACTLTSGTLLLVGILAKMQSSEKVLDRRKEPVAFQNQAKMLLTTASAQSMVLRAVSLGLPFYAAMQIGGLRTGLVLLSSNGLTLTGTDVPLGLMANEWMHFLSSRIASVVVIVLSMLLDFAGLTFQAPFLHLSTGYLALALSVFVLPLPLPTLPRTGGYQFTSKFSLSGVSTSSRLTASAAEANITILSGLLLFIITIGMSMIWSVAPSIGSSAMSFSTLSIAAMSAAILFAQPHTLLNQSQAGVGLGCLLTACCAFLYSPSLWPGTICNGGLSALSFLAVLYDTEDDDDGHVHELQHTSVAHAHHYHGRHHHVPPPASGSFSTFTKFILDRCEPGSLLHGILSEKDSRRIAYFTALNFAFMFVQGVYGYLSGSLGLLSDTVHMFFDCLGLVVGLGAAVASKFPPTPEKPYGWGKLNTLAGFGNGVFLMLVSVEFVWEAIEGIVEHTELRHVKELLVVSIAGLIVNMIGLFAFGHAHAGHDHGHSHNHGHDHEHDHEHDHGHDHGHDHHDHNHDHANGHAHGSICAHDHSHEHKDHGHHGHGHGHNENMHGIFLHVAADAGGSSAVIISTALTLWKPWYLWDPLATIIIAILIFVAAVPLVVASGQKLLLVIPDEAEYTVKNTLQDLSELRGVVGYAAPRFWIDEGDSSADVHGHHHDHGHGVSPTGDQKVMGMIHVIAANAADVEDIRERVDELVREKGMDLVIHVEREVDGPCWCGGAPPRSG